MCRDTVLEKTKLGTNNNIEVVGAKMEEVVEKKIFSSSRNLKSRVPY
jgi:hypothetical protein